VRSGIIALVSTLVLLPIVRRLCIHWRLYDSVGPLKIHSQAIPRLGGVAIALAFAAGISFAGHLSQMHAWPFFLGLILIWGAGLVDDIWLLSPTSRLAAQIGAAILLWFGGWRLPWLKPDPANLVAVCFLTLFFINSFNFLDGVDGLCAGVAGIITASYLIFPGFALSLVGAIVAWSLLGVSAGFLVFNFPPARIFMGDSGSTALGFSVAFLAFDFCRANVTSESHIALAAPLLMAALPLLDGILTVLRRLHRKRSPLHGDRRHFYDLLLELGWSPRKVTLTVYTLTAAMCIIGWICLKSDFTHALLLCAASTGALTIAAVRLGILRSNEKRRPEFGAAQIDSCEKTLRNPLSSDS
jgi:UDP-GlcNAc:undecaprenyl-phosphate/decaprenyl-phosphate GlcNAc-1-phosphate transferase